MIFFFACIHAFNVDVGGKANKMSLLEQITPSPRKVMILFYLIDTSESMRGSRIKSVNSAMKECQGLLKEISQANDDSEIRIAVLQFSSGCSWITPQKGPVQLEEWYWENLQPGGITDFGAALLELDKKLSRNEFLNSQTGAYAAICGGWRSQMRLPTVVVRTPNGRPAAA